MTTVEPAARGPDGGEEALGPDRTGAPPALEFRGVEKRYGRTRALEGISCALRPGTIAGLVGANGSGKSTLLKLAAGLIRPTRGEVRVLGRPPGRAAKLQVAYMPEVDPLFPWMRVREAVAFVRTFFPDWDGEREEELREILELPAERRVGEVSKGMRTRLRLLLALARTAPVVLLDEPFSGIDPPSRTRIARGILAACRDAERAVLLSTHDLKDAEPLFDRLLVLAQGRLVLEGDAEELRRQHGKSIEGLVEEVLAG